MLVTYKQTYYADTDNLIRQRAKRVSTKQIKCYILRDFTIFIIFKSHMLGFEI